MKIVETSVALRKFNTNIGIKHLFSNYLLKVLYITSYSINNKASDIEIKNIVTIATGEWGGDG